MKKLFVVLGLVVALSPAFAGQLGGTNLGVVTGVVTKQVDGKLHSTIVTSGGRVFTALAQYTNVAEIGAPLLLVTERKSRRLCNIKGGACAPVESEQK